MRGDIQRSIVEYMNLRSNKKFTYLIASGIKTAIEEELVDRRAKDIEIKSLTNKGKEEINKRTAEIINRNLGIKLKAEDIRLYKRCRIYEFENRTGKCAWGFQDVRERKGFDPITGYEKED